MPAVDQNLKEINQSLRIEEEEKHSPQNIPASDDLSIVDASQNNANKDRKCPSSQVRDREQANVQGADHASLPDKTVTKGLKPAEFCLKANLLA